jgi:hypothetical protein
LVLEERGGIEKKRDEQQNKKRVLSLPVSPPPRFLPIVSLSSLSLSLSLSLSP